MGGNTCENLLSIPKNSNFEGELPLEFVGIFGNPKKISVWELFMAIPGDLSKIPENISQFGLAVNFSFLFKCQ